MNKLFPSDQIIESEHFDAHQDWEIPIVGMFIIASKDTTKRSVMDFDNEELRELFEVMKKIRIAMKEVLGIQDVYLFQNEDTEHGFHMWLFPRHEWMEKFGRKIQSVRPIINASKERYSEEPHLSEVSEAARKVRAYLST